MADFQRKIARIVLEASEPFGFALAGGYAMNEVGLIDRPTKDIDGFTFIFDPTGFAEAVSVVKRELLKRDFVIEDILTMDFRAAFVVSDNTSDDSTEVELSYYHRYQDPVRVQDLGLVLSTYDLVSGKITAFWERQAPRDYLDINYILQNPEFTPRELFEMLQQSRTESTLTEFVQALKNAPAWIHEYSTYGLSQKQIDELIMHCADAATTLEPED